MHFASVTVLLLSQGLLCLAGQIGSRLSQEENDTGAAKVRACTAKFHPRDLSNENLRKIHIFFNGYDQRFLSDIQCLEVDTESFVCEGGGFSSDALPSKRLAKAHVLLYEMCARAAGDQTILLDMFASTSLPETAETLHPASVLNDICQQNKWMKTMERVDHDLQLTIQKANGEQAIPPQRKRIGSSIHYARYCLIVQALQVLVSRTSAMTMEKLAQVIRGTSLQFEQTVLEEESDTVEYKMADDDRLAALRLHLKRYLCSTAVGFLNGPLLGNKHEEVKRIVFGVTDDLIVRGYRLDLHARDHLEQRVNSLLYNISPRHMFEAKVNWIPVVGCPEPEERFVMEVMILRRNKEDEEEQETIVFAEKGDHDKIFIRLGPATYQLGRI